MRRNAKIAVLFEKKRELKLIIGYEGFKLDAVKRIQVYKK